MIRPGDANEAAEAWRAAMTHIGAARVVGVEPASSRPLTAQRWRRRANSRAAPTYFGETKGRSAEIILLASGSELHLAVGAREELEKRGHAVRVVQHAQVSELFEQQDAAYRDSVLPPALRRRLAIEAASPMSWYRWIGLEGDMLGMTTFGASGPYQNVLKHFGFTVENVVDARIEAARAVTQSRTGRGDGKMTDS